jgi:hypothetical protein
MVDDGGLMRIGRRLITGLATTAVVALVIAGCSSAPDGSRGATGSGTVGGTSGAGATVVVPSGPLTRDQQVDLAAQAYVFGLPLVVTRRTMATFSGSGPLNTLLRARALATPQSKAVVAPNRDTLYLFAPIDVAAQPLILTVPEVKDRYFAIQFIDAYTDVHDYIGTRVDGGAAGTYAVTGPGFTGTLPPGVKQIRMRTPQGVLLGRVRVRDDADLEAAHAVQDQVTLVPLAAFLGQPDTAAKVVLGAPPGTPQTAADAGVGFFDELGDGLAANPPTTDVQRALVDRLAAIGVGPGRHPSQDGSVGGGATAVAAPDATTAVTAPIDPSVFTDGIKDGEARIAAKERDLQGNARNGWRLNTDLGQYGDDLVLRAAVAQIGWGANGPEEALYPQAATDVDGTPLTGASRYVIHFDAGQLPPVQDLGFWSLTVYTPDRFLTANPIDRYSVGGDTPGLLTNADGSLDVYLQHDAPVGHEANWLPTPVGAFTMSLRMYLPQPAAIDGTYTYPTVRAVG